MTRSEAEEHLKKSTVKIDSPYDVGSGFFIDKNLIATCHHVVKECSASELEIVWQGNSYQATSIESNPNDDLALVSVKIDTKHPSVQIDKSIETGDECFAFGFPKAHRELGDTLTFVSEGHNKKFLKFKDGQFESGFSGAPILNYRTLKVCGIVNRTRDEYSDLGGRGIPISKLFNFESLDIDDNGSIFSKEMFKNWVWTSSVESANKLQFSVLALVETLVAVGVSFYLWFHEIYWHTFSILALVAPFLFLRTKKSEHEALLFFDKNISKIIRIEVIALASLLLLNNLYTSDFINILVTIITLIVCYGCSKVHFFQVYTNVLFMGMNVVWIKIFFTFKNLSFSQLLVIPKNWFKIILATDILHPIEVLPGIYKTKSIYKTSAFRNYMKSSKFYHFIGGFIAYNIIFLILIVPTLIYRYSLKSTAWIYFPLIWLIEPQDKSDLNLRMKQYSQNFIAYMMFLYSWIIIFVFTLLPLLFPPFITIYTQNLPKELETIFFAYSSNFSHWYGIWYITRFLSALITIVFMFSFTKILNKRENHPTYGDKIGAKILSLKVIRNGCIYITLGFTAYHILTLLPDNFLGELWANMKVLPEE